MWRKLICSALILLTRTSAFAAEKAVVSFGPAPMANLFPKMKETLEKENISLEPLNQNGVSTNNALIALDVGRVEAVVGGADWDILIKQIEKQGVQLKNKDKFYRKILTVEQTPFITHKTGPKSLSKEDIQKIFTAKVRNWKELGHEDLSITIAIPTNFKATIETLSAKYLNGEAPRGIIKNFDDFKSLHDYVKATPGAIALGPMSVATAEVNVPSAPELPRQMMFISIGEPSGKIKKVLEAAEKHSLAK